MNGREDFNDEILANQIPEYVGEVATDENEVSNEQPVRESAIGKKLRIKTGAMETHDNAEAVYEEVERRKLTKLGEKIQDTADIRDGWIVVDRMLLGERDYFYPEDWSFRIKPATVEAVKNWSMIDDEDSNSIDDVFNEILKSCLSIRTATGQVSWNQINSWDRFFFVLLIREYTFAKGEKNIHFFEDCPNCEQPVEFKLTSQALMYDMPDSDVLKYYNRNTRTWQIDPNEFGIDATDYITLYVPTVEKDANIKAWMISKYRENNNFKVDTVFMKFVSWLAPKISRDDNIARKQIENHQMKYKQWDIDTFNFMDDVVKNIVVTPSTNIITVCPNCGEEVTARIRFQDGVSSLFAMGNRHKKFGSK